jgi:hypothetical protein
MLRDRPPLVKWKGKAQKSHGTASYGPKNVAPQIGYVKKTKLDRAMTFVWTITEQQLSSTNPVKIAARLQIRNGIAMLQKIGLKTHNGES